MITQSTNYDVVVIGSGPAGMNAALEAARQGARVLIVEQERHVGGACVQYGTIPSKTLRETAVTLTAFQRRSGEVYRISRDAELQISSLMRRLDQVVHAHQETTRSCLELAGVERVCGRATFVSPHEVAITSVTRERSVVRADYLVIATGSSPRTPPHIAVDHENILDSDSLLSMTYLPGSLTVIGSGVIACEYASIFACLGVRVTVVDRWPAPLGFLDPELVDIFLSRFTESGGQFRGNCDIARVDWDGVSSVRVTLAGGEVIPSDKAFVALGRVASLEALSVENAGLQPSKQGLVTVNDFCQTEIPHIYAVGDAIGPPALASASMEQGRRAVCHALSHAESASQRLIPSGIYTIPEIAMVGLSEKQAAEQTGGVMVGRAHFSQLARAHIMACSSGMLKLIADQRGEKLLGAQIAGDGATELIHLGQMALIGGMPVDVFVNSTFNFPTMAEAYRLAALEIVHARERHGSDRATVPASSPAAAIFSAPINSADPRGWR